MHAMVAANGVSRVGWSQVVESDAGVRWVVVPSRAGVASWQAVTRGMEPDRSSCVHCAARLWRACQC